MMTKKKHLVLGAAAALALPALLLSGAGPAQAKQQCDECCDEQDPWSGFSYFLPVTQPPRIGCPQSSPWESYPPQYYPPQYYPPQYYPPEYYPPP